MLNFFGDVRSFGYEIKEKTESAVDDTFQESPSLRLNVALGYGGRKDIVKTCKELAIDYKAGRIKTNDIDEDMIAATSQVPDDNIDLIIRTGGDKRLSNFLLFQAAYAEFMFIDKLWPDFTKDDFIKCLNSFKKVRRRFGKRV